MTVNHLWIANEICEVHHGRSETTAQMSSKGLSWEAFARCATLCSRTDFEANQEKVEILDRACIGDASETAILKYMESAFTNVAQYRDEKRKIVEKPFNSTNKYQLSIHFIEKNESNYVICMKGKVIEMFKVILQYTRTYCINLQAHQKKYFNCVQKS